MGAERIALSIIEKDVFLFANIGLRAAFTDKNRYG